MAENVLLKNILDSFFEKIGADDRVPKPLVSQLNQLRSDGKIAKGTNLKNLIETFSAEIKDENSKSKD